MDKRPQRLAKNKTDLMPKNASCKRWDTLVNIRLTRFNQVGRLYGAIIAAQVIRSCALAKRDVGPTSSSKRSSPHSCRLTGARPRSLLSEIRSSNPWS